MIQLDIDLETRFDRYLGKAEAIALRSLDQHVAQSGAEAGLTRRVALLAEQGVKLRVIE